MDVKDTINQWLEAQVVEVRNNRAYIHYNGWGTRWDEWIEVNSPRIALFRTHTIQSATANYLSPFPNSPPDTAQNVVLATPSSTTLDNLTKITELSSKTLYMMKELKTLKNRYEKRIKIQREMVEEECKKRQLRKKMEKTKSQYTSKLDKDLEEKQNEEDSEGEIRVKEEAKEEVDEDQSEFEKKDLKQMINDNALLYQQIILLSGQLAPIMDRVGRLYTDFSPHLLNNVNTFNNEHNSVASRITENRRRNRGRQNERVNNRNRSEENSQRSDLDEERDDGDLSRSSDSLSRGSNASGNREGGDRNAGGSEIRNRLRSISNTISRIRSSINSMRSLIFNNLGRTEREEDNENDFRIDERGDRRITVNAQIPILSSPGDIASVHNIFDRFVDRQMVNIISGDNNTNRNRNNRPQQPNATANDQNTSSERSSNNAENEENNRNRRGHTHTHDLSELFGDGGGLGFLNSALGGLGNAGEAIELHIHAFVPQGNNPASILRQQANNPNVTNPNITNPRADTNTRANNNPFLRRPQPTATMPTTTDTSLSANIPSSTNPTNPIPLIEATQTSVQSTGTPMRPSGSYWSQNPFLRPQTEVPQVPPLAARFEDKGVQVTERMSRRGRRDRNREREEWESNDLSMSNGSIQLSRNHSPSSFRRKEIDEEDLRKCDISCQTELKMMDQGIQNTTNMYVQWTQTTDQSTRTRPSAPSMTDLTKIDSEQLCEKKPIKKELRRGNSNQIKKKKSVISKASIKKVNEATTPASDVVFSPGDRRTSSKIYSSTMKKGSSMSTTIQTRATGSTPTSNRFLFRGNEEFHNSVGRSEGLATTLKEKEPKFYVGNSKK